MVAVGDSAPEFTAPMANGNVAEVTLSDLLADGPLVLAFFPAAFTGTCTSEMEAFEDRLAEFDEHDARVVGVSADLPFALNAFREDSGLSFPMIGDTNRQLVEAYDVRTDFAASGVEDIAQRAVFVVDADGVVQYEWASDDPGREPDYDAVYDAVATLT